MEGVSVVRAMLSDSVVPYADLLPSLLNALPFLVGC